VARKKVHRGGRRGRRGDEKRGLSLLVGRMDRVMSRRGRREEKKK
jgi:hypothetical protein